MSAATCYTAVTPEEASLLVLDLRSNGIDATALDAANAAVFADLPTDALRTQVVVPQDQLDRARELVARFLDGQQARGAGQRVGWRCDACGERNGPAFEVCWSCQAVAPCAE